MPIITSAYKNTSIPLFNGHLQTIYPALFRKIPLHGLLKRERITTPDNDFLDTDYYPNGSRTLAIISHGLEGDSRRPYMLGMIRHLLNYDLDVVAWNYRTCSGEMNTQTRMYHMGATDDLAFVVQHYIDKKLYDKIVLLGFSAGGNITLKYLGENGNRIPEIIKKAIVFSVPCHLSQCTQELQKLSNQIYERRFLKSLLYKASLKAKQIPQQIDWSKLQKVKHIWDYDEYITAPLHGFEGAEDYYHKSSSLNFIKGIIIPTLIVNAHNDPFLGDKSYPTEIVKNLENVYLEMPETGGHCGFYSKGPSYWSEQRAIEYLIEG